MINITICDPYGFIYITTNLITGEKYIGQKKFENGNHKNRWVNYLGSTSILRCCQNKYKQAGGYVWRYKV